MNAIKETLQSARINVVYIFLISIVAALGAVMFGFDVAIISGAAPLVQQHFHLNELQLGWGVSSLLVGCMIGSMFAGRMAEAYGRKRVLLSIALVFAFTSILTAIAPEFSFFVIVRLLGGLAVGAASMLSPLYIAEISPASIRGRMVALNQLGITFGILVSYLINYLLHGLGPNSWRWMFATGAIPSILFFILLFLVPESPRWLFSVGKDAEAQAVLERIGGTESAEQELNAVREHRDEKTVSSNDLFLPQNRRVMMVGLLLAFLVQASGINTIVDYAPIILRSAGNGIDLAMFQTFVIGFIFFSFTFVAVFTVDRIGRRPLYIIGSAGMTISLALLSVGFFVGRVQGFVGLILILVFIASFAACIGPVFWILISEIFPRRIRGLAMSAAVFTCWLSNFIVVLFFPWVLKHMGGSATFGLLSIMSLTMLVAAWKLPETSGRTLEEIEHQWEHYGH
jgi:MFS transporter, SP family, arabinose:H+ symporter